MIGRSTSNGHAGDPTGSRIGERIDDHNGRRISGHAGDHTGDIRGDDDDVDDTDADLLDAVAATDIRLYDATDLPWISIVIDHVMACLGQPWRVLRERLDHAPIRGNRVAAILGAMRRMMDGRAQRTKVARKVRATVLGPPALDDTARLARLANASEDLGIDPSEIESLLWIDLADERPVTLPDGRPDEQRLAAYANVDRIQRALRRARHVRVHAWGNAHALIRAAARYGLLVRVSSSACTPYDARGDHRASELHTRDAPDLCASPNALDTRDAPTVIDIVGPLSLFHQTHVYGRSLGAIVPYLSGLERFVVEIDADFGYGTAALRVTSPAMLPPAPNSERGKPSIASKIASALERTRNVLVERDPPPIPHGTDRLFPDLAFEVLGPIGLQKKSRLALVVDANDDSTGDSATNADANEREDDRELFPDLAALLVAQMDDEAERIAPRLPSRAPADRLGDRRLGRSLDRAPRDHRAPRDERPPGDERAPRDERPPRDERAPRGDRVPRDREIVATLPPRDTPDRSRCWFVEVVGFATTEYLTAKLARYAAAGIDRVALVVDDTRDASLAEVRRVVAYSRTIVADLLAITEEAT
jgi:predicted nuclease of restriction endonuclease-like RecB superfamily